MNKRECLCIKCGPYGQVCTKCAYVLGPRDHVNMTRCCKKYMCDDCTEKWRHDRGVFLRRGLALVECPFCDLDNITDKKKELLIHPLIKSLKATLQNFNGNDESVLLVVHKIIKDFLNYNTIDKRKFYANLINGNTDNIDLYRWHVTTDDWSICKNK